MKKLWTALLLTVLVLALAACGAGDKKDEDKKAADTNDDANKEATKEESAGDNIKLVVGASNNPHAVILEKAAPLLAEEGIELKIEKYTDYVLPNQDLDSEDLDANYYQHIPFFESQKKEFGYDFANAGGVHIEPIGIYSKRHKSLEELPEGATIMISSSIPDHGRMLSLLEAQGLIKLADGVDKTEATLKDIAENPKNFKFDDGTAPEMLVQMYQNDEADAILINSNFALDHDINPMDEAIALEAEESPYVNIVAVRSGDEDRPEIKKLMEVLHSKEIQDFIIEEWKGSIVPVNE